MKSNLLLTQSFIMFSFLSCSHAPESNKTVEFSIEQQEQMSKEALSIASKRLEQMVIQAKSNRTSINYLSTDLFLKANMSLLEGDFVTASVLFKHLVDLVPEDHFIQKKYAISLIRVGDMEGSLPVLEKLYKNGQEEKVGLILAGVYTGMDKENQARMVYSQILKSNPKSEDACVFLSKSYAIDKQSQKAFALLDKCSANESKNGIYDYYKGKLYVDGGQIQKGIEAFKKAYAKQPSLGQAVNALGLIYEERERQKEAVALYEEYLKKHPSDQTILSRVVQVLFLKEQYEKVISYAERLSDLEPDNLNLKIKLGILYTDVKKFNQAVSIFKDLLSVAPQSDKILYYLGAIYQEMRHYEQSIEYFNQIPVSSALYSDSSIQMANMLSTLAQEEFLKKQGNHWKETFLTHVDQKLKELSELKIEFSVIKSGFYESISQFKEAMDAMVLVQNEKGFSTQHKYYLANLFEKESKFVESKALIMGILEKEPKNAHAWNFLGYALLVRGEEMDEAYKCITKALEISPNDGYIRDSLGWYYYKKGDLKKALSHLELAFKKVPDDIEVLKHLAQIHHELKNYPKARNYLESALKNARYHSERQEILMTMEKLESDRLPTSNVD